MPPDPSIEGTSTSPSPTYGTPQVQRPHMKAAVALALSFIPATGAAAGAPAHFELFGHFDNVVSNDQGVHCGGYSLDLWSAEGV